MKGHAVRIFLVVSLLHCTPIQSDPDNSVVQLSAEDKARYADMIEKAVADVINAEPHEISHSLTAITPWNNDIIWSKDRTHILMVTWVPEWAIKRFYPQSISDSYFKHRLWSIQNIGIEAVPGKESAGGLQEYTWRMKEPILKVASLGSIWASPVKEVFYFVKNYQDKKNNPYKDGTKRPPFFVRMSQWLGLVGDNQQWGESVQKRAFVEFWARPADLARPCIDTEIVDKECTLDRYQGYDMSTLLPITDAEKKWFITQKEQSFIKNKIPWTRLGYTYDWGNAQDHVQRDALPHQGVSEFILKPGAIVILNRIIKDTEYSNHPSMNTKEGAAVDLTELPLE